jgi:hypothetical protein
VFRLSHAGEEEPESERFGTQLHRGLTGIGTCCSGHNIGSDMRWDERPYIVE